MNIGTLNAAIASRSSASSSVSDVSSAQQLSAPPRLPESDDSSRVSLSKGGELMQQLSDLQKSDPEKFKQVVDQISQKFSDLASSKSGGEAEGLSRLADAFKKVADTGDLSSLRPSHGERGRGSSEQVQGQAEGGQSARAAASYRQNAAPPPPPRASLEEAFSQALSIVSAETGSRSSGSSSKAVAGVGGVLAA